MVAIHDTAADPVRPFGKLQARILAETLPYLRAYHSKTFVVDYGLRGTGDPAAWHSLGRDLALLSLVGLRLVVVHRGGSLNGELVSLINRHGGRAVGVSGLDGGFLQVYAAAPGAAGGLAGESVQVDPELLQMYFSRGLLPVVRPLATGPDGQACPVDGGRAAAAIATRLSAAKLIVMGDAPGILGERGRVLHRLSASGLEAQAPRGEHRHLAEALRAGVGAVHVVDARRLEVLLLEILTRDSQGSLVLPDPVAGVIARSAQYLELSQHGDESDETR